MKTAIDRVKELNAETAAWVAADPANRWAGFLVVDADHWADNGCHTAEDVDKHLAWGAYWDAYRDVYGCRPRHTGKAAFTLEELEAEVDRLHAELREQEELRLAILEDEAYLAGLQPPARDHWDEIADRLER